MTNEVKPTAELQKKMKKRDIILAEASQLFNERGYHDTRLEDIASKTGTGKTNISYHFKSKETILEEAYTIACDFSDAEIKIAAQASNGLERAIAFVRSHMQAHANALSGNRASLTLLSDFSAFNEPEHSIFRNRFDRHVEGFRSFLLDGLKDGSVHITSVEASTFFVFSLIQWLPRWLDDISERKRDEAIDNLCNLLRYGLAQDQDRSPTAPLTQSGSAAYPAIFDKKTRNRLKRDAFLRTGTRFLNRDGYRNLSLDDIARELGVTRGAFYYHIADKEQLFISCFERTCALIEESCILAQQSRPEDSLCELEQSIRWLFEGHVTNLNPLLRLNLLNALDPAPKAAIQARLRGLQASYAEMIARGMMDGSIKSNSIEACEQIIIGSIFAASGQRFAATQLYESWTPIDEPVGASAAYFEPLIKGLAAH